MYFDFSYEIRRKNGQSPADFPIAILVSRAAEMGFDSYCEISDDKRVIYLSLATDVIHPIMTLNQEKGRQYEIKVTRQTEG